MPNQEPEIIEAEIVQEVDTSHAKHTILTGEVTPVQKLRANQPPAWHTPGDHARPKGDLGGIVGGFLTLAVGFLVTVLVLLVSVCIIIPFTVLMRLLNGRKSN